MGVCSDVLFVRDHNDCFSFVVECVQEAHDSFSGCAIEVAGRFICEDEFGIVGKRACDRDALFFSAGELVGFVEHAVTEFDRVEQVLSFCCACFLGDTLEEHGHHDVFERGEVACEVECLEDEAYFLAADARQGVFVHVCDVVAVEQDCSFGGEVEAADEVEGRAFASAAGSLDCDEFPLFHAEVNAAECVDADITELVSFPHLFEFDDCFHSNFFLRNVAYKSLDAAGVYYLFEKRKRY